MKTHVLNKAGSSTLLAALVFVLSAVASHAATLLQDNFNSGTAGNPIPAPWTTAGTGTSLYSATSITGLSANVTNTNAGGTVNQYFFNRALSSPFSLASNETLSMTFSVSPAQTNFQTTLRLADNSGFVPVAINFLNTAQIAVTSGAGLSFFSGTYTAGSWYDITVTLYAATDTFDVAIVNHATGTNFGTPKTGLAVGSTNTITQFSTFAISNNSSNADFFLDNLLVASVPEPSAASCVVLGVAGLAWRGRKGRKGLQA